VRKVWLIVQGHLFWTREMIQGDPPRWAVLKDASTPPHAEGPIARRGDPRMLGPVWELEARRGASWLRRRSWKR